MLIFLTYRVAIIGIVIDQLSKKIARNLLSERSFDFGVLRFDLVFNSGTAYGFLSDYTIWLTLLGVIVIAFIMTQLSAMVDDAFDSFIFGCLLGGGIGNTIDRILFSEVTDFINIHIIPVFNIADILLNIGLYGLILRLFLFRKPQKEQHK